MRVHLLRGDTLRRYQPKRKGNFAVNARLTRLDTWLPQNGVREVDAHDTDAAWLAFHGWKPGFHPLDANAVSDQLRLHATYQQLGWLVDEPVDLRAVTIRALVDFAALQNPWELEQLLGRVAALAPRRIVEIGTSAGGLLYALAQVAPDDATLISVDVPPPHDPPDVVEAVTALLPSLVRPSQRLHLIRQPSSFHSVREDVRGLLDGPIDLLVIDGDHSYGAVRADVEMYAPMVRAGGLTVLHDIAVTPENSGRGFDVGVFWPELERAHRTERILDPAGVPGIASQLDVPLRKRLPVAYGFGLIHA